MSKKRSQAVYEACLKSFCPDIVLSKLYRRRETNVSVEGKTARGVCLLADISGFTKLSGELCSKGVEGLDALRQATSSFLSQFISTVYYFDGDVISFAGDALVCMFWSSDTQSIEEDERIARNAICCGSILKDIQTDKLSAHIAVSIGDMCFAFLGGFNDKWVYIVNGRCMSQLSQCIDDASSREMVTTLELLNILTSSYSSCIQYDTLPSGNILIKDLNFDMLKKSAPPSPTAIAGSTTRPKLKKGGLSYSEHILKFLPHPVVSSLRAGYFEPISELRIVTTMFLKLDTYSFERHRNLVLLQPFFHSAQRSLSRSGGCLRQFLVDDKGCVLIGLWGVPSSAFVNNGARALCCASSILLAAKELNHVCSVGITTGSAFCGTIGSPLRQDYAAIGNCVNMAARLMGKAQGRILIDSTTYHSLSDDLRTPVVMLEPMMLKGRASPIAPYCVDPAQIDTFFSPEIYQLVYQGIQPNSPARGHEPEVDESVQCSMIAHHVSLSRYITQPLNDALTRLSNYSTSASPPSPSEAASPSLMQFIVLEGAQGMGKTEAAKYFRSLCSTASIPCYFIRATDDDERLEYGISRQLFAMIVGVDLQTIPDRKQIAMEILQRTYPDLSIESLVTLKFPFLKAALGLKWHLSIRSVDIAKSFLTAMQITPSSKYSCATVLVDIMRVYLGATPAAIVIDNANYCDKLTWNHLHLMSISLKLPIVALLTVRKLSIEEMMIPYIMLTGRAAASPLVTPRGTRLQKAKGFRFRKTPVMVAVDSLLLDTLHRESGYGNIRLILAELELAQTRDVVESILGPSEQLSDSFIQLVADVSSRNPYWCVCISEFVKEIGVENFSKSIEDSSSSSPEVSTKKGTRELTNQLGYLRTLVTCMMDTLSVTEQLVLKISSAIGQKFSVAVLRDIIPIDAKNRLGEALRVLAHRRFIVRSSSHEEIYTFQNHNIREVVYSVIPPSDASVLHYKIASKIETIYAANLKPFYDTLLYHYTMSVNSPLSSREGHSKFSFDESTSYNDSRSKLLDISTRATREAIQLGAMTSVLDYLQLSESMCRQPEELQALSHLVDDALKGLHQCDDEIWDDSNLRFQDYEVGDAELQDFQIRLSKRLKYIKRDASI